MDMKDCWFFVCYLSWTLGPESKCSQLRYFIGITLVDAHLNWLNWFHFLILEGGLTCYSNRLNDVTAAISWCYKIVYINSFFPCIARLWTSLPAEWFPLSYEFRVYRRLLSLVLSKQLSYLLFNFFFLLTLCLLVVAHLCMEWISIIKEILFDYGIV